MRQRGSLVWIGWTAVVMISCDQAPPPPSGTGAREAAQRFCAAILEKDWTQAYAALHPDSRTRYSASEFAHQAGRYRRDLGFAPVAVRIRFCQEQGTKAITHIMWNDAARERFDKDALILQATPQGWGVVLPRNFGSGRRR